MNKIIIITDYVSPETLEEEKANYCQAYVQVTNEEAKEIELATRNQVGSEWWKGERRKRSTASTDDSIEEHIGLTTKYMEKTDSSVLDFSQVLRSFHEVMCATIRLSGKVLDPIQVRMACVRDVV